MKEGKATHVRSQVFEPANRSLECSERRVRPRSHPQARYYFDFMLSLNVGPLGQCELGHAFEDVGSGLVGSGDVAVPSRFVDRIEYVMQGGDEGGPRPGGIVIKDALLLVCEPHPGWEPDACERLSR